MLVRVFNRKMRKVICMQSFFCHKLHEFSRIEFVESAEEKSKETTQSCHCEKRSNLTTTSPKV